MSYLEIRSAMLVKPGSLLRQQVFIFPLLSHTDANELWQQWRILTTMQDDMGFTDRIKQHRNFSVVRVLGFAQSLSICIRNPTLNKIRCNIGERQRESCMIVLQTLSVQLLCVLARYSVESSEHSAVWSLSYPVFCQVHWIETLKKAKENNFRGKHIQSNKFTPLL